MNKAYYAKKGLFVGITSIICSFYFFAPTFFTFKSSLIKQSGAIEFVKIFYSSVESSRGSKSIKSELKFTLNSTRNMYVLMKNIGQSRYNERFEKLKKQLEKPGRVSVWIKKNQQTEYKPTVFQITKGNNTVLYDFDEAKSQSRLGFLISFGFGIFGVGLFIKHKYSTQIKKLFKV
ncbi:hypothetical protein [Seonamhaeicola marinus]|uniref:DUF3592 domain-containing protein n=1 Tax=Seonamhaeicola marinus TaxID=1912246 RepID=A0A5D0HV59_9FLAO|nr:hypothetical protein [Seonamhaeicola marinus]TYA74359.1 hypothetical protein FUA24_13625 [Seonamhaeicola marinus]